ncbi:hypothetical protein LTR62_006587 [Meristemomyces frigidus]|uniref:YTH domain-containing protein n=1 Tax=Meristemomyces frigidus TaxID=1508187 RepID=A0AAN7YPR7_9PEZI|nr:hypothetical protein LTR62_006587 [Meristemomyces frigidus]
MGNASFESSMVHEQPGSYPREIHNALVEVGQSQPAFHTQFDCLSQHSHRNDPQYAGPAFDFSGMSSALPFPEVPYDHNAQTVLSPGSVFQMQRAAHLGVQRGPHQRGPRALPSQIIAPQFPISVIDGHRHQMQYPQFDGFGYGPSAAQCSPVNALFSPASPAIDGIGYGHFPRQVAEPAPVPAFPRGPPRKPKQSGHALWVGNLPPAANITDLKDHFSRDATKDIESLFLISKSNCAFVNYRSEAASLAAMNRFHDSRFHGVRLVCRLRRGSTAGPASAKSIVGSPSPVPSKDGSVTPPLVVSPRDLDTPVIVDSLKSGQQVPTNTQGSTGASPQVQASKVPEKYFIIKSLTVQDLEASVRNGTWATQSHNEPGLARAYGEAENVYLIFSANKSGEYFGYARMTSPISGEPVNLGPSADADEAKTTGTPQSIPTLATDFAPRGRIIDDSARGTIFWEADLSNVEDESPVRESSDVSSGQHWGRQFSIEWLSTARLPFFRTRGLCNPWNANREVKIARDGTELEPGVGWRLVAMFQRPAPVVHGGPVLLSVGPSFQQ